MTALVWFRNDLRLADNDALAQAVANHDKVVAVFAAVEAQWRSHDWAPMKLDLLQRQVQFLGADLGQAGIELEVVKADYFRQLPAKLLQVCKRYSVEAVYANREYPLDEVRRDRAVDSWLSEHGVTCHWFDSNLMQPPEAIKTQTGGYYQKFTPFFKAWCRAIAEQGVAAPRPLKKSRALENKSIDFITGSTRNSEAWAGTETTIRERLSRFVREQAADYKQLRDTPAVDATSRLSPFFELGVIAPRAAARLLAKHSPDFPFGLDAGMHTWLSELAWREFYQHLMFHCPRLSQGKAFLAYTDAYPWRHNQADFDKWCRGETGFPIVDAGMRQLQAEGWMHNRVRMIVANFLVKDLHIDWRWGEQFFMQNLIDGSFPANNGGWQWSASTGTDAAPYFRVFNPTRQSEQVDPEGRYIRKWVEQLESVPNKHIHAPHPYLQAHGGATSANGYAAPIVDHKEARNTFIATFKGLKK